MRTLSRVLTAVIFAVGLALAARPVSGLSAQAAAPTPPPGPALIAPIDGEPLQGAVSITGRTAVEGFVSAELAFAYVSNPTDTWFPIWSSTEPVEEGKLATWDTTVITDSTYNLRLIVNLADGSQRVSMARGLRVRNYTPIETPTPTLPATAPAQVSPATSTPTPTVTPVYPTATPLPTSAAALTNSAVAASIVQGAGAAAALFALLGAYLGLRALLRR